MHLMATMVRAQNTCCCHFSTPSAGLSLCDNSDLSKGTTLRKFFCYVHSIWNRRYCWQERFQLLFFFVHQLLLGTRISRFRILGDTDAFMHCIPFSMQSLQGRKAGLITAWPFLLHTSQTAFKLTQSLHWLQQFAGTLSLVDIWLCFKRLRHMVND